MLLLAHRPLLARPLLTRTLAAHAAAAGLLAWALSAPLAARADGPHGDDGQARPGAGPGFALGIGLMSSQKPYLGIDRDNTVLPLVRYENRWVRVMGPGVEFKLPGLALGGAQRLDFGLLLGYDFNGYKPGDAPILAGMDTRHAGLAAGARLGWRSGLADVGVRWLGDASGHHHGQRLELGVEKNLRFGATMLEPRLKATWLDSKYVDYYYGVRPSEAIVGRAAYTGAATVNVELGARAVYLFDRHHSVFTDLAVTRLGAAIKDSPLVGRTTENRVGMGYMFRF